MVKIENEDVFYKELLVVDSNAGKHTCDVIGIRDDGSLLFIKEKEAHSGNAYFMMREFYQIDNIEYYNYLGLAVKNKRIERLIYKGRIILEVCYRGSYFKIGSAISYLVIHHKCCIFTDDSEYAEKNGFNRIDKFEYEKTIGIKELDYIRIIYKDTDDGAILMKQEIKPAEFEKWLDSLL